MRSWIVTDCTDRENVYNGVHFDVDRPEAHTVSAITPSFPPWVTALNMIKAVHSAFGEHSIRFKVHLVDIFPPSGDFKFLQQPSGAQIIVEVKKMHCAFDLNQGKHSFMTHEQYALGFAAKKLIFSYKAQWDYIYTTNELDRKTALLIPRDMIPRSFWNARPPMGQRLVWPTDSLGDLKKCVVHVEPHSQMVKDMESILDAVGCQTQSVKAQRPLPYDPSVINESDTVEGEGVEQDWGLGLLSASIAEDTVTPHGDCGIESKPGTVSKRPRQKRHTWSPQDYERGFGSHLHPELRGKSYEAWAAGALIEMFRQWSVV